ncbi:hypothetical protein [Micromonospora sp. NPDC005313]|uniref:hypothetical protein n=1 Tax=Micromonospora sp. NPDC005313 TaxID=3154296 RepID=UPI0033A62550
MNDNGHPFDRRRLLAGAAAASAVTLTGLTVASTTAAVAAPGRAAAPLVSRDRIATAALRAPDGSAPAVAVQADFHARLAAWLAFWSANSPSPWSVPVQVVARIETAGDALVLHAIRSDGPPAGSRSAAEGAGAPGESLGARVTRPVVGDVTRQPGQTSRT